MSSPVLTRTEVTDFCHRSTTSRTHDGGAGECENWTLSESTVGVGGSTLRRHRELPIPDFVCYHNPVADRFLVLRFNETHTILFRHLLGRVGRVQPGYWLDFRIPEIKPETGGRDCRGTRQHYTVTL